MVVRFKARFDVQSVPAFNAVRFLQNLEFVQFSQILD